jgi:quinol monooxygenase YgiN
MSAVVVVEVMAQDGRADELKEFIHAILPDTRAFDGCLTVNLVHVMAELSTMLIHETWTSRQRYEKYFSRRQDTGVVDKLMSCLSGPPTLRFFDVVE